MPHGPRQSQTLDFFVLTLEGKGHHKLEIAVRLKITRDGGWRSVDGLLPAAPASACAITVPLSQTEVRLTRLSDRQSYDTRKAGRNHHHGPRAGRIAGGSLAGEGGRNESRSRLDRPERRGARRAGRRPALDVATESRFPRKNAGGIHRRCAGDVRRRESRRRQRPRLAGREKRLRPNRENHAAESGERPRANRARALEGRGDRAQGSEKEFSVELVQLNQAALHTGRILIRRSPLLDLRTLDRAGMTRSDIPQELAKLVGAENVASPLNVQAFRGILVRPQSVGRDALGRRADRSENDGQRAIDPENHRREPHVG